MVLVTLIILLAFSSFATTVDAIRSLSEDGNVAVPSIDKSMYLRMHCWFMQLASGPSDRGAGH